MRRMGEYGQGWLWGPQEAPGMGLQLCFKLVGVEEKAKGQILEELPGSVDGTMHPS